jgi:DNA-binding NarL/FixJ family response regulator
VATRLAEHLGDDDPTTRELEVLRLIRDGYRNKQIADQPSIAETTVNFHIKNLVDNFHGGNTGSNPVGDASLESATSRDSPKNS